MNRAGRWIRCGGACLVLFIALAVDLRAIDLAPQYSRDQVLQTLQEWTAPAAGAVLPDFDSRRPALAALEKLACDGADAELVRALCLYQLANPDTDFDFPARVLGQVYLEQPGTVLDVLRSLPGIAQIKLEPYLIFGWEQAVAEKNRSAPRIVERQKKLDRYKADLMNVSLREN